MEPLPSPRWWCLPTDAPTRASTVVLNSGRIGRGKRLRVDVRGFGTTLCSRAHGRRALWLAPDLLVVDGGKPQLTAAIKQLEALGLDIPVCGLAKADEEVFVPWDETPVVLPTGSASLYLIKQVRDESHRFAITFHRELRDKAMTVSVLDDVPGVGPTRKRALCAILVR